MIVASGFVTALERTKFVFGRGSASDPAGGAYSAPPGPLAGLRGPTSNEKGVRREIGGKRERKGREKRKLKEKKGRRGKGREGPLSQIPRSAPECVDLYSESVAPQIGSVR